MLCECSQRPFLTPCRWKVTAQRDRVTSSEHTVGVEDEGWPQKSGFESRCLVGCLWMSWATTEQGSPAPGPWTGTGLWSVRNLATQQEVSSKQASEASGVFTATPPHSPYCLTPLPVRSVWALDSHRSVDPPVNCACGRSRLHAAYENHPETIPPSLEKLSSMKPVPGTQTSGDPCHRASQP